MNFDLHFYLPITNVAANANSLSYAKIDNIKKTELGEKK